jgi:hypothetical protein
VDTALYSGAVDEREALTTRGLLVVGVVSGLLGGLVMSIPIVIWDWARSSHRALELPMAVTAWSFGLVHFSRDENLWWPIVVGVVLLAAFWALSGVAFIAFADRAARPPHMAWAVAVGAIWSFATFIFSWYMLLPIARDGAPFRATAADPALFTAPNWAWILGFTLSGLAMAGCYAALGRSPALRHEQHRRDRPDESRARLRPAA